MANNYVERANKTYLQFSCESIYLDLFFVGPKRVRPICIAIPSNLSIYQLHTIELYFWRKNFMLLTPPLGSLHTYGKTKWCSMRWEKNVLSLLTPTLGVKVNNFFFILLETVLAEIQEGGWIGFQNFLKQFDIFQ